jgi:hypothetical protein
VTADQYLEATVAKYAVANGPGSDGEREACALSRLISEWAGRDLVGFQLSGAYEKGTAVTFGTDVDILVSVKKPGDARAVYLSLYQHCVDKHLPPEASGVAIRITSNGLKVHLIPWNLDRVQQEGGLQSNIGNCQHTLYDHRRGRTIETNLSRQIDYVRASGRTDEIRAFKIWRERNQLDWPSFYLELTVIQALDEAEAPVSGMLAKNISTVLHYLNTDFARVLAVDPANEENVVSDELSLKEKNVIARAARKSLAMGAWERVLW